MAVATTKLVKDKVIELILSAGVAELTVSNVFARQDAARLERDPDIICIVVVSVRHLPPSNLGVATNSTINWMYPVTVVLSRKGLKGSILAPAVDEWLLQAQFDLENILRCHLLLGADGVIRRCTYVPKPSFNRSGYGANVKVTAFGYQYRSEENRTQ